MRGLLLAVALAGSAAGVTAAALAAELPRIDVEAYCRWAESLAYGRLDPHGFNTCIRAEQEAYDQLKNKTWAEASEEVQKACIEHERIVPNPSYRTLAPCLREEHEVRAKNPNGKFRY
jgi:hypothetical protein